MNWVIIGLLALIVSNQLLASEKVRKSATNLPIPFDDLFSRYSLIHGVSKRLMVAIVSHESRFNPRAENEETEADKRKGRDVDSIGLAQILYPDTAKALRPNITKEELFNPETNLKLAYELMSGLLRAYPRKDDSGFPSYAVAAYNAGSPRFTSNKVFVNQKYVDLVKKQWEKFDYV